MTTETKLQTATTLREMMFETYGQDEKKVAILEHAYELTEYHETMVHNLKRVMHNARLQMDDADRDLANGRTPNACGILQSHGAEVDMYLGYASASEKAARSAQRLARDLGYLQ